MEQYLKKIRGFIGGCKRRTACFLLTAILATGILPLFQYTRSYAAAGVVDGVTWNYILSNGCATHVYPTGTIPLGSDGSLIVPGKIGAYTVTSVGNTDYENRSGTAWGGAASLYLPDSVTRIEPVGFAGNPSLEKISGKNVREVGGKAFLRNYKLKEVYFPALKKIESGGFAHCRALENAYFPLLETIADVAFYKALSPECSFFIGNQVTFIGAGAFFSAGMKLVEIHAVSPKPANDYFNSIFHTSYFDYSKDGYYDDYGQVVKAVFENCINLTDVVVGAEVQYFYGRAFSVYQKIDRNFYFLNPNLVMTPSRDNFSHYTDTPPTNYLGGCPYNVMTLVFAPENAYLKEYVAKYAAKAADQVEVSSLEEWEAAGKDIPSAIPKEYVKPESIEAVYSGSVIEGLELAPAQVSITVRNNDGSREVISGSASGVTFNTRTISSIGENLIMVSYKGLSARMSVVGTAKSVTGISAELNESYLNGNKITGWNGTKKAFEVGSVLEPAMFTVKENYNNGTSAALAANAYTLSVDKVGNLQGNLVTITKKGTAFTAVVTVTGYSGSLDGAMEDLEVPAGDYNALSQKITDLKNELLSKTEELDTYEAIMKEIKESIGMDGSFVEMEELQEISSAIAKKAEELKALEKDLKELQEMLADILGQEIPSEEASVVESIRMQLEEAGSQLEEARGQAEALVRFGNAVKEQLGLSIDASEEDVLNKINGLMEQISNDSATKEQLIEEMKGLKWDLGLLRDEKQRLEEEKAEFKEQVSDLEKGKAGLESQVAALEKGRTELESRVDTLEKGKVGLESQIAALEKGKAGLESQVTALEKGKASAESQAVVLKKEKTELESQIAMLEKEKSSLESQIAILKREKTELQENAAIWEREKAGIENQTAALKKENAELERKKAEAEENGRKAGQVNRELENQISALEKKKAALDKNKPTQGGEKKTSGGEGSQADSGQRELREQISELQKERMTLTREKEDLEEKNHKLELANAGLENQNQELKREAEASWKEEGIVIKDGNAEREGFKMAGSSSGARASGGIGLMLLAVFGINGGIFLYFRKRH